MDLMCFVRLLGVRLCISLPLVRAFTFPSTADCPQLLFLVATSVNGSSDISSQQEKMPHGSSQKGHFDREQLEHGPASSTVTSAIRVQVAGLAASLHLALSYPQQSRFGMYQRFAGTLTSSPAALHTEPAHGMPLRLDLVLGAVYADRGVGGACCNLLLRWLQCSLAGEILVPSSWN